MYVKRMVQECDFNDEKFDEPVDGVAMIAKGATGRYCEVMWGGPKVLADLIDEGITVHTYEEARELADSDPYGWAEF